MSHFSRITEAQEAMRKLDAELADNKSQFIVQKIAKYMRKYEASWEQLCEIGLPVGVEWPCEFQSSLINYSNLISKEQS